MAAVSCLSGYDKSKQISCCHGMKTSVIFLGLGLTLNFYSRIEVIVNVPLRCTEVLRADGRRAENAWCDSQQDCCYLFPSLYKNPDF